MFLICAFPNLQLMMFMKVLNLYFTNIYIQSRLFSFCFTSTWFHEKTSAVTNLTVLTHFLSESIDFESHVDVFYLDV